MFPFFHSSGSGISLIKKSLSVVNNGIFVAGKKALYTKPGRPSQPGALAGDKFLITLSNSSNVNGWDSDLKSIMGGVQLSSCLKRDVLSISVSEYNSV